MLRTRHTAYSFEATVKCQEVHVAPQQTSCTAIGSAIQGNFSTEAVRDPSEM